MSIARKWRISVVLAALCLCVSGSLAAQTSTPDLFGGGPSGMSSSVNWPEFGFIPSGGRFNPLERTLSPSNVHQLHQLWSFFTGCSGGTCGGSSATVVNGVVYLGSYDGNVYALNAATGVKLWSFQTVGKVFSSPAVAHGTV